MPISFRILKELPEYTQCQLVYTAHTQIVYIVGSVYFVFLSSRNEGKGKKKKKKKTTVMYRLKADARATYPSALPSVVYTYK